MTTEPNQFSVVSLFALGLVLFVSRGYAMTAQDRAFDRLQKNSSRALLQNAHLRAAHELAQLKAELARETQKRLAGFTYDSETNVAEVASAIEATRLAASVANERASQTR